MTFETYSETVRDRMATLAQARASGDNERILNAAIRLDNAIYDLQRSVAPIISEAFEARCAKYDAGLAEPFPLSLAAETEAFQREGVS